MTPVEIARQALRRLAELGLPPTPENYAVQYHSIAGVPGPVPSAAPAPPPTPPAAQPRDPAQIEKMVEMVRGLLGAMSDTNDGLHADLTRFSSESNSLLAQAQGRSDPAAANELFRAMTDSTSWLLQQVESTQQELARTRGQLDQVHGELERAQSQASSDPLTGVANRRGLDAALSRELARAQRHSTNLCLAVIDIDHFKKINDQYGHDVGDLALKHLAQVTASCIRETDVLARFGGEEFVLVLPDTVLTGAEFTLNRLLRSVERSTLAAGGAQIVIRFSAGLTQWQSGETADQLIKRADAAMYAAKRAGRARVVVAEEPHPSGALPSTAS